MTTQDQYSQADVVLGLQQTVARQQAEIQQLQEQLQREQFAEDLRKLLTSLLATSQVLTPFSRSHLLDMVVQTAARFLHARASSLFLIDEGERELLFEVTTGPVAEEIKRFHVPIGHGVAGLVALTGQPLAIANARQDTRLAVDIAFAVNYVPESILCVPLYYDDRVIGVLELLDKHTAPSFSPGDIEMAGQFANLAAIAIAQSNTFQDQQALFHSIIRSSDGISEEQRQDLFQASEIFTTWTSNTDQLGKKARELALCVQELILDGEQSCDLCMHMLQGVVTSVRERKKLYTHLSRERGLSLTPGW